MVGVYSNKEDNVVLVGRKVTNYFIKDGSKKPFSFISIRMNKKDAIKYIKFRSKVGFKHKTKKINGIILIYSKI